MHGWKPNREEAEFLGRCMTIDNTIAKQCADLLRKGHSLASVRDTLESALNIAGMVGKSA